MTCIPIILLSAHHTPQVRDNHRFPSGAIFSIDFFLIASMHWMPLEATTLSIAHAASQFGVQPCQINLSRGKYPIKNVAHSPMRKCNS